VKIHPIVMSEQRLVRHNNVQRNFSSLSSIIKNRSVPSKRRKVPIVKKVRFKIFETLWLIDFPSDSSVVVALKSEVVHGVPPFQDDVFEQSPVVDDCLESPSSLIFQSDLIVNYSIPKTPNKLIVVNDTSRQRVSVRSCRALIRIRGISPNIRFV